MRKLTLKKRFLTLAVCVLAWVGANAWIVTFNADRTVATITSQSGQSYNFSDIQYSGLNAGENGADLLRAALTLNFVADANNPIGSDIQAFQTPPFAATTVDFSQATFVETPVGTITYQRWNPTTKQTETATVQKTYNSMTFKYFPNVENAVLANVQTLCASTFDNNFEVTTTFVIPSTVQVIAGHAVDDTPIASITIPATVQYIENQAFQNSEIKNLIDVTVKGYTAAANGAFDKQTTVGQTDAGYERYATLHFPEGQEDYFTNQEHQLDQATSLNAGLFQAWLNQHYEAAKTCSNPNGWKEFMSSGGGDPEEVPAGVILRTYSDNKAHMVPMQFRAYIVNGVTADSSPTTGYTLVLQEIFAIPANTGVILYGEVSADANGKYTFTLPVLKGDWLNIAPYDRNSGTMTVDNKAVSMKNYLVECVAQKTLRPYVVTNNGVVTDRNFIMSKFQSTTLKNSSVDDYVGFFRVKSGVKCGPNKAYLSFPATVFNLAEGAEAIVVKPDGHTPPTTGTFREAQWNTAVSTGNWGPRARTLGVLRSKAINEPEPKIDSDNTFKDSRTTGKADDPIISLLNGTKTTFTTKGVVVKNGKKFVIK
ncbi:MAG: leucine-rich repeat protein [Prevotella sp.]|nr:leucine-rich repeat protein [Prevotella sp.]